MWCGNLNFEEAESGSVFLNSVCSLSSFLECRGVVSRAAERLVSPSCISRRQHCLTGNALYVLVLYVLVPYDDGLDMTVLFCSVSFILCCRLPWRPRIYRPPNHTWQWVSAFLDFHRPCRVSDGFWTLSVKFSRILLIASRNTGTANYSYVRLIHSM